MNLEKQNNKVVLHLGSNVGFKAQNLKNAVELIRLSVGEIELISRVYETEAWGIEDQEDFLNQAVLVNTLFSAEEVLYKVLHIERRLGRRRLLKWGPRIIDIDIIFYNQDIIKLEELEIPHPWMHQRSFVLDPLNEIIPNWEHPEIGKKVSELSEELENKIIEKVH